MNAESKQTVTKRNEGKNIATESEYALTKDISFFVSEHDMLLDLKVLMSDYYVATFTKEEKSLQIAFSNGQKFRISVEECL